MPRGSIVRCSTTHGMPRKQLSDVQLANVFNTAPLARRVTFAVALAGSLVVFAVAAPEAMGVWTRRNLMFSRELWPRRTHLHVDGFGENGHMKVARGTTGRWRCVPMPLRIARFPKSSRCAIARMTACGDART